jgi:hypothetical protein
MTQAWIKKRKLEQDRLKCMRQAFPSEQARLMALYGSGSNGKLPQGAKDAGRCETPSPKSKR